MRPHFRVNQVWDLPFFLQQEIKESHSNGGVSHVGMNFTSFLVIVQIQQRKIFEEALEWVVNFGHALFYDQALLYHPFKPQILLESICLLNALLDLLKHSRRKTVLALAQNDKHLVNFCNRESEYNHFLDEI
jgi:hypothetical protein